MNILIRSVFNRPEMLYLSIKYEIAARKYYQNDDIKTIFAVDYGGDPGCLDVIKRYPFEKFVIQRPYRHKVCANIMEALRATTQHIDTYFINLEDDCVLHKTYFKFVDEALKLIPDKKFSVLTTWGLSPHGDPSVLKPGVFSCGPGTVISKYFFDKYMLEHATETYYRNWIPTIDAVNRRNEINPNAKYSIKKGNQHDHLDWDGLMNRLVDTALFEEGVHSYSSLCYRLLHIGFFGFNRPYGRYPKELDTFTKRVEFLERGIYEPKLLEQLDGVYKDYNTFDSRLDSWDGGLLLNA